MFRGLVYATVILVSCAQLSCKSTEKKSDVASSSQNRAVASEPPISFVNPQTGKGFWQEYTESQSLVHKAKQAGLSKEALGKILKPKLVTFITWVRANPIPVFQDVREHSPVLRMEALPIKNSPYKFGDTVVLSRFNDVKEALDNPTVLTVRNYGERMANSVGPFMLAYDGSQYSIKEKPWMRQMMPPSDHTRIRQMVRALVQDAIKEESYIGVDIEGQYFGRLELVNQVARKVPLQLSGAYFGFHGPSLEKMYEWSRATQDDFFHNIGGDPQVGANALKAGKEMHAYLKQHIAQRKIDIESGQDTTDDILGRLIRNKVNDFVAPKNAEDDRIRTNVIGTLVGGAETTQAAIVQSINELLKRPEMFERARQAALSDDVDTVAKYVWEALRFHPVNPFVVRYAEKDFTLKTGEKIAKGSHVLIATQSAMFDDSVPTFENPNEFRIDRDQSKFFHLGYGHHRCLGDHVALIEVPEIVAAILRLPGVRRASGGAGQLDFRKRLSANATKKDDVSTSFPESFVIEYDASASDKNQIEIASQSYKYEDYLMDFNRDSYRQCLAGLVIGDKKTSGLDVVGALRRNIKVHKHNAVSNDNRDLLFCRLNEKFRSCMIDQAKKGKFILLNGGTEHANAFANCQARSPLTETEVAFYRNVMLGQALDESKLDLKQSQRTTGPEFAFEDQLKFYDRYTYRECFMNPAGLSSFKHSKDMMMYARFNIDFRLCMGGPVLKHKFTGGLVGKPREAQYEICKDGVYNPAIQRKEGALSRAEKYFYQNQVLGQKVNFRDIPEAK